MPNTRSITTSIANQMNNNERRNKMRTIEAYSTILMTSRWKFIRNSKHCRHTLARVGSNGTVSLVSICGIHVLVVVLLLIFFVMLRQWHIAGSWIRRWLGVKWNFVYNICGQILHICFWWYSSSHTHTLTHTARRVESLIAQFKVARWSKNYANARGVWGGRMVADTSHRCGKDK